MMINYMGAAIALLFVLFVNVANAADIAGKFGISGHIGILFPSDSEVTGRAHIGTDNDLAWGGGVIYGVTRNIAVELDITSASYTGQYASEFDTINIALGGQYRFGEMNNFNPYLGAGIDVLINDADVDGGPFPDSVDTVVGGHISGGLDYFVARNIALTSELKYVFARHADMYMRGERLAMSIPRVTT